MLHISDLTVKYGPIAALRNLSMVVERAKLAAVIGANGSGKSTLLKTIMGWIRPVSGVIEIDGVRIDGAPPHRCARCGLAYVPEGRRLFSDLTVMENLELGAYTMESRKTRKTMLREIFAKFPILEKRRNQPARTLSGGEQQMTAIARALMSRPKLLMLDEPSLGLSPKIASTVFDIVGNLRKEGITCLLVEQNVGRALQLADSAFVLQHGSVMVHGNGSDLLKNDSLKGAYLGV
jgi:branched-chain amino acid transport system ATP-binding protein